MGVKPLYGRFYNAVRMPAGRQHPGGGGELSVLEKARRPARSGRQAADHERPDLHADRRDAGRISLA